MKHSYRDSKTERLCTDFGHAKKFLGDDAAKRLFRRIDDLHAATAVTDLVAGHPHPLDGNRFGQFAVDVTGAQRLILTPTENPYPKKVDGGIDWAAVNNVLILDIEDYHGRKKR